MSRRGIQYYGPREPGLKPLSLICVNIITSFAAFIENRNLICAIYAKLVVVKSCATSTEMLFIGGVHKSGSRFVADLVNHAENLRCAKPNVVFSGILWNYFNHGI